MTDRRMTLLELAQAVSPDQAISIPAKWLIEALASAAPAGAVAKVTAGEPAIDLTVAQVAVRFGKASSTIRAWLEAGEFPGAYKLHAREWRVPIAAIAAFQAHHQGAPAKEPQPLPSSGRLSGWREVAAQQRSGRDTVYRRLACRD
jgi:hypothetical protein